MKFSIKDFFSKCDQILNGKLHFLCSEIYIHAIYYVKIFLLAFCIERKRETERDRDRQTDRQTERDREKERDRERDRERQRDRERERQRDRETKRQADRERWSYWKAAEIWLYDITYKKIHYKFPL